MLYLRLVLYIWLCTGCCTCEEVLPVGAELLPGLLPPRAVCKLLYIFPVHQSKGRESKRWQGETSRGHIRPQPAPLVPPKNPRKIPEMGLCFWVSFLGFLWDFSWLFCPVLYSSVAHSCWLCVHSAACASYSWYFLACLHAYCTEGMRLCPCKYAPLTNSERSRS